MKFTKRFTAALFLLSSLAGVQSANAAQDAHDAHDAIVTPVLTQPLPEFPGKEALMITVVYPPGSKDPVHRHNAHAFIYVLEGKIIMAVKGGKEVTLTPGQTWHEGPDDVHTVGRNASNTKPAKFVVLLIKDKDAPVLVPEK
ncbi:cupin domain-containing protein [Cupriavidus sp. 2TAF22]|uniref:cupin domain-containing protein n=1 Tax=unclassified Cupriavidus TaxID=2640874 RepID=UPI003F8E22B2